MKYVSAGLFLTFLAVVFWMVCLLVSWGALYGLQWLLSLYGGRVQLPHDVFIQHVAIPVAFFLWLLVLIPIAGRLLLDSFELDQVLKELSREKAEKAKLQEEFQKLQSKVPEKEVTV